MSIKPLTFDLLEKRGGFAHVVVQVVFQTFSNPTKFKQLSVTYSFIEFDAEGFQTILEINEWDN